MKAESLTIEIAGKTVLLRAKEGRLPDFVRDLPDDFKKKPVGGVPAGTAPYSLLFFRKELPRNGPTGNGGGAPAVEIRGNNGAFEVTLASKPRRSLGAIYPEKGKADFFVYDGMPRQNYFVPFLRNAFQFFSARAGGFILHASAVRTAAGGLVFTGASGAGKTTIAKFYPGKSVLSDELIYLQRTCAGYSVSATPWEAANQGTCGLAKIVFPEKSKTLQIIRETPGAAVYKIMTNILHLPESAGISENVLDLLAELTAKVPCFTMRFPRNDKFKKAI